MATGDGMVHSEPAPTSIAAKAHRAYLLGEQHSVTGIQELRGMLHSEAPSVRKMAASALDKLADLDFDKQPVVKALVDIGCSDAYPQVRQYALKALKRYVPFLAQYGGRILKVAQDKEQKEYVRQAAQNLFDMFRVPRSNAVLSSSRCNVARPEAALEPTYKEIISNPNQYLKGEQLIAWTAKTTSPMLIKGGAGSGKTIVAMLRAIYARRMSLETFFGKGRVAFLTYDKLLNKEIATALSGMDVSVMTVDAWVYRYLQAIGDDLSKRLPTDRGASQLFNECFRKAWSIVFPVADKRAVASKSRRFYLDEISWMKGRGIDSEEAYISSDRSGRGSAARLGADDRKLIWRLRKTYERLYTEAGLETFEDRAGRALRIVQEKGVPEGLMFDHVVIDEAQDFNYIKLRLSVEMTRGNTPDEKGLTLVADVAQEIYRTGFSWKDADIAVQGGRTKVFQKNYRNTKQIAEAAYSLMSHDADDGEMTKMQLPIKEGKKPQIWFCGEGSGEAGRMRMRQAILDAIESLDGTRVVAAYTTAEVDKLKEFFAAKGFSINVKEPIGYSSSGSSVNALPSKGIIYLRTLHHLKGLQFDHVFLSGMSDETFRIDPGDEKADSVFRKLVYVGMTRACRTLTMFSCYRPCKYLREIESTLVVQKEF